jgi:hypothetical protein
MAFALQINSGALQAALVNATQMKKLV